MLLWIGELVDSVPDNWWKVLGGTLFGATLLGSLVTVNIHCADSPPDDIPPIDGPGFSERRECVEAGCVTAVIPDPLVVDVLQDAFWVLESVTELERGPIGDWYAVGIVNAAFYDAADAVVAVGMASEEGDPEIERNRARRRADQILNTLRPRAEKKLYRLLLGQYARKTGRGDTFDQRRALVLGIREVDDGMERQDIENALCLAIDNEYNFGFRTNEYQGCDLQNG
ncbi:MAG: hypothetical protein AAGI52_18655 [Bacteroidota bacterium]